MAILFDRSLDAPYRALVPLSARVGRVLAPNPGPFTFRGTGVYIVGAGAEVAVIDPGPDIPGHLESLKRAIGARRVSHILVTHTHADHSPAARAIQEWSGAPIHGFGPHPPRREGGAIEDGGGDGGAVEEGGDRDFMPDIFVRDGDVIAGPDFTFACVHTPGHISNHVCYALAEERALFSGDHVMGWSTSVVGPPDGDMADYMASLEKVIARRDALLYPTHGSPVRDPETFVPALLGHRRAREAEILACLDQGVGAIPDIVARLYRGLDPLLQAAAQATVAAHLIKLEREGRVVAGPPAY